MFSRSFEVRDTETNQTETAWESRCCLVSQPTIRDLQMQSDAPSFPGMLPFVSKSFFVALFHYHIMSSMLYFNELKHYFGLIYK